MASKVFAMDQNLVDEPTDRITVRKIHEKDLTSEVLDDFFARSSASQSIGLSPAYMSGNVHTLAIALESKVLLVQFGARLMPDQINKGAGNSESAGKNKKGNAHVRQLLEDRVLRRPHGNVVAFDLAPLALVLYSNYGLKLDNGVDIQSCLSAKDRHPLQSIKLAAAEEIEIFEENIIAAFRKKEHDQDDNRDLVFRAWVSHYITQLAGMEECFDKAKKINVSAFNDRDMDLLSRFAQNSLRQVLKKAPHVVHSTTTAWDRKESRINVTSNRFQNRIRQHGVDQYLKYEIQSPNGKYVMTGKANKINGKHTSITTTGVFEGKVIQTVATIGQEGHTSAEAQRDAVILRVLQGKKELLADNPWIQNIWLSSQSLSWPPIWSSKKVPQHNGTIERQLNDSQLSAVQRMLSIEDKDRLLLIQGPPGTGKTSVIACFVEEAIKAGYKGLWLVAQSNVAVKNIAEKLASNNFIKWKLIVSQDFRFQWHEHLYKRICGNVIQSDRLRSLRPTAFEGCQVILCTLSMLSSPAFISCLVPKLIPINNLIVDEASQIEIGEYLPVFTRYPTIRKVCFIGDDKQLPPHGQEDIAELQSIFELANTRRLTLFLDTQYRMPPHIGDFISGAVYDGKLLSNPSHPITNATKSCFFIDVVGGKEQAYLKSWMNLAERKAVLAIAKHLETQECPYRIITPYEAQRSLIEEDMKAEDLPWGDKVFNVDSFQGNEDDYIIISLVRSRELGFLKNLRRTNVMLTRCKRGMFICSSRAFLTSPQGSNSLVGKLLKHTGEDGWLNLEELESLSL